MGVSMVMEKCNMLADQMALDYLGNQGAPPAGSAGEKPTESSACWCCGGREVVRSGGHMFATGDVWTDFYEEPCPVCKGEME